MRELQRSEIDSVSGGGDDPNFSGREGCPDGYTGVSLFTTSTTSANGAGGSTTSGVTGVTSGVSTTVTTTPGTTTESVRYECLRVISPSGGGGGAGSSSSGSAGTSPNDDGVESDLQP